MAEGIIRINDENVENPKNENKYISIRMNSGHAMNLYGLHPNNTVLDVKRKIESEKGYAIAQQQLCSNGNVLKDDRALAYYHVEHTNNLFLKLKQDKRTCVLL